MSRGLTPEQEAEFYRAGLLRLPAAVPRADAEAMADVLWDELARAHRIHRDHPETWRNKRPAQLSGPARRGAFKALASPTVRAVIDQLIGPSGWDEPRWGAPLVTMPAPGPVWDVPHKHWHLDIGLHPAGAGEPDPPIARVFVILAPLQTRGGGTLLVQGSHKLVQRAAEAAGAKLSSAEAREALKQRHPWFARLFSPTEVDDRVRAFMDEAASVDGVDVRVVEMTGEPGDAWLMHPFLLHAFSPNRREAPRLALTQWIYGRPREAG